MCREAKGRRVGHAWVLRKEGAGKAAEGWARGGRELGKVTRETEAEEGEGRALESSCKGRSCV